MKLYAYLDLKWPNFAKLVTSFNLCPVWFFCYCLLGDHCEKCLDGWYGNATNATPNDCSPCPCPGGPFAVNQFAKTCVLSSDGLPTCVNCTVGHEGRYCERCMDGYFGRPRVSVRLSDIWNLNKRHSYVVKPKTKLIKMTHQNIGKPRLKLTWIWRNRI